MSKNQNQNQSVNPINSAIESLPTKSAKIRYLFANNFSKSQIAQILEIRYQHVRNVLLAPVKK